MGRDRISNNERADGVDVVPATAADLATYQAAREQLAQMRVPLLHPAGDADSRLFVMGFDGTGNDMGQQPRKNWTNVALLHDQLRERQRSDPRVDNLLVVGGHAEPADTRMLQP